MERLDRPFVPQAVRLPHQGAPFATREFGEGEAQTKSKIAAGRNLAAEIRLHSDDQDGSRIASPEMLPSLTLLPQLKCSPAARRSGGGHEAGEHGDA